MPAYSKSIQHRCEVCGRGATREVMDRFNGHFGYFCSADAKRKVEWLNKQYPDSKISVTQVVTL